MFQLVAPVVGEKRGGHVHYQDDTRLDRLRRSVTRLARRAHIQDRLGRRNQNGHTNGDIPVRNGTNGHYNFPRRDNPLTSRLRLGSNKKVEMLTRTATEQRQEIQSLKDCVHHLRGSLQLSDAQNLALQVLLKKMAKAESKLPLPPRRVEKSEFRSQMRKSEQQLENLVSELKEMSQTKYPTISSNHHSSSVLSFNGITKPVTDTALEDDLLGVSNTISGVRRDLTTTQKQIRRISRTLDPDNEFKTNTSMMEAYEALLKTEQEIEVLR